MVFACCLFQAFLEDPKQPGKFQVALDPVCSTSIFDAKARKELQIMDISDVTAPADGGKKILIFCEKVAREDIRYCYERLIGEVVQSWRRPLLGPLPG